jgi:alkylation response protein AidB-like acyl-CoA dehydrogenase
MQFAYTSDQIAMRDALRRLFEKELSFPKVKAFADGQAVQWDLGATLSSSGALDTLKPEAQGGLGLGRVDMVAILTECGRALTPWPVSQTLIFRGVACADPAILDLLDAKTDMATLAMESDLRAVASEDQWRVSGNLPELPWGMEARWLLAAVSGAPGLLVIDLAEAGVTRSSTSPLDLTSRMGSVAFDRAGARLVTSASVEAVRRDWALAMAAEAFGVAEACLEKTVAYLKERTQFGKAIGSFQALKHIAADDAIRVESMRVALLYAAWSIDSESEDSNLAVCVAKSYVSEASRLVASNAIQLHGGIGYTWEFGMHLALRRILHCSVLGGTTDHHRETLANALLETSQDFHPAAAYQLS